MSYKHHQFDTRMGTVILFYYITLHYIILCYRTLTALTGEVDFGSFDICHLQDVSYFLCHSYEIQIEIPNENVGSLILRTSNNR